MRYASVCSGVEAASLAWMPLGWEAVFFAEIEPFPCAVLKERFPGVPNLGDMTEIKGEKYHGTVDLLVGGTPCQSFSVAGKQAGLRGVSGLALTYCELLASMRPHWFVWENVPGVFSTNGGEDFKTLLRTFDEIGYSVAWRVLDAQYVRVDGFPRAVPQRRRRVFVVGHLGGDWRYPASVLFEPDCLPGDTPPRRVKGAGVARSLTASTGGASRKEQQHTFISGDGRPLNALGVNGLVMDTEFWNGEDVSTTLTEAFADDRMPDKGKLPCVICRAGDMANAETGVNVRTTLLASQYKSPPFVCAGFSGGQGAKAGTGGCNLPLVQECFPINSMIIGKNVKVGDRQTTGIGNNGDPLPTISSAHHHAVAVAENIIGRKENTGANGTGAQIELAYTQNATGVMGVSVNTSVRRLLPVECERLMGFPDNWTRIPWQGKSAEDCPDSPRYKACGNSMCVNVMRWIGMRIEKVERRMKGIDNE